MPRFGGPATMMRLPAADSPAGPRRRLHRRAARHRHQPPAGRALRPARRSAPSRRCCGPTTWPPAPRRSTPCRSPTWATCRSTPSRSRSRWRSSSAFYRRVLAAGCKPLTLGGDHTIALPILRALAAPARSGGAGACRRPCRRQRRDVRRAHRARHAVPARGRGRPAARRQGLADRPARHRLRRRRLRLAAPPGLHDRAGARGLVPLAGAADGARCASASAARPAT